MQWESKEQQYLIQWFRLKYRDVKIVASANGGSRNKFEAANLKRSGVTAGVPDIQILKAARGYHGLFIELKATPSKLRKKGVVSEAQKVLIDYLNQEGYLAVVCWGWVEAKDKIDWYLRGKL